MVLIGVVVATLFVSLAAMAFRDATKSDPSSGPSATASLTKIAIKSGYDFDPDGDETENGDSVPNAYDGLADTSWETERYRDTPNLGGLKPGVGIVLDLGEVKPVSTLKLTLTGEPTSLQVLVPSGDKPGAAYSDWSEVAAVADGGTTVELTLAKPASTRYLLVWLTSVPKASDGRYVGEINEIAILG